GLREFTLQREDLLQQVAAAASSEIQLPADIYLRNSEELDGTLGRLLRLSPAVSFVSLHDTEGASLSTRERFPGAMDGAPAFKALRAAAPSDLDPLLTSHRGAIGPPASALLAILAAGEKVIDLSLPVFSAVNPTRNNLTRSDFGLALAMPQGSRFVVGYLHIGISSSMLLMLTLPTLGVMAGVALLIIIAASWLIGRYTRRLTAPRAPGTNGRQHRGWQRRPTADS
ncbi:MAG: hypothetical protein ACNA7T_03345, partial [Haliea sp.]